MCSTAQAPVLAFGLSFIGLLVTCIQEELGGSIQVSRHSVPPLFVNIEHLGLLALALLTLPGFAIQE